MTDNSERNVDLTNSNITRQILAFIALVFAFSCFPYFLVIHAGHLSTGNGTVVGLLMWCPALAAFAACKIFRIDVATLGWKWRPVRYEVWAYLLPIVYSIPVYIAVWLFIDGSFGFSAFATKMSAAFGFPHWPHAATLLLAIPSYAFVGVIASMARALGEEIGWRGFLLPRLVGRAGFTKGCLLSGCIWAVWHYPLLLFADYNSGTPRMYALTCFTLMVIGDAFIFGWFRLKSGSLWPAAMLHASHNLFIQAIFDRITNPVANTLYVTTEFGFGLALTVGACAFYFWTRRGEVAG
ncbi:MAG TPA: type II CAAX endopeptidase family protein [Acidobacteriaceae bacterium]|jgi:membrane protease YdiL (CAAX protease family)|nr:type II CAAX endopeptidase family protein [Acidobacteriaceae bacterium]